MGIQVKKGDLSDPRVADLLRRHLISARAETMPGSAHALDVAGLQDESVSFWTVWEDDALIGMGAMKRLDDEHYEVKSMHVEKGCRRCGVGTIMLDYIVGQAQARGAARLSLETGSWDYFRPAVELYRRNGFIECAPFDKYVEDPNSIFMTKALT